MQFPKSAIDKNIVERFQLCAQIVRKIGALTNCDELLFEY